MEINLLTTAKLDILGYSTTPDQAPATLSTLFVSPLVLELVYTNEPSVMVKLVPPSRLDLSMQLSYNKTANNSSRRIEFLALFRGRCVECCCIVMHQLNFSARQIVAAADLFLREEVKKKFGSGQLPLCLEMCLWRDISNQRSICPIPNFPLHLFPRKEVTTNVSIHDATVNVSDGRRSRATQCWRRFGWLCVCRGSSPSLPPSPRPNRNPYFSLALAVPQALSYGGYDPRDMGWMYSVFGIKDGLDLADGSASELDYFDSSHSSPPILADELH